ncbi:MAG: PQQ-binding-like beta-propeller repeat protein, partial [Lentisphaeria bacterium]|nr:PQQ-binding-like beta-propeller repeat protein [Lentisphaeria bacterium]
RIYLGTGWNRAHLLAVRLDPEASGDVTATHVDWEAKDNVSRFSTPLVLGDTIFLIDDGGWASLLDAKDGTQLWKERVAGRVLASPVAAGNRVYVFDQKGLGVVLEPSREGPLVQAKNQLPDGCHASPAVIGGTLVVRTATHLYRIGAK